MKKKILIFLLIIWMITVFFFSMEQAERSSNTSGKVIKTVLKVTNQPQTKENVEKLQFPVRKLAHLTLYTIGGIIAILLLNEYDISIRKKILISELIILLYAISDEIHQYFIPGRGAKITDVLIDSVGRINWNINNRNVCKEKKQLKEGKIKCTKKL